MTWVVDKSLDVLLRQIDEAAPNRSKASDGSVGDPDHQARDSDHNPQDSEDSSDGNDPDDQVDARDFTHDPRNGADMHVVAEALRASRDPRILYVIFDGRIFSSYPTSTRKAWEWGTYSGENDHSKHMHVSVNDLLNDTVTLWKIGIDDMQLSDKLTSTDPKVNGKSLNEAFGMMLIRLDYLANRLGLAATLERIEAAALDDGDVTVQMSAEQVAELKSVIDALRADLPGLIADEEAQRLSS